MNIVMRPIDSIRPYNRNPRLNAGAVDAVAESIKEFGFKVPLVLDRDGIVAAGHTRLLAAKQLGLTEVPVIVADDLSPEQVKAFRIADNRLAQIAEWDLDLLPVELSELRGMDVDMELLGFGAEELERIVSGPAFGPEYDESIADGISVCLCPTCGHEHCRSKDENG